MLPAALNGMECILPGICHVLFLAAQDDASKSLSHLKDLQSQLDKQLDNIRNDTKQAIALSSSSVRSELEVATAARVKESERKLVQRIEGDTAPTAHPSACLHTR